MKEAGKIYISDGLAAKESIPTDHQINVRVGGVLVMAQLIIRQSDHNTYLLSPSLTRALYLERGKKLQIRYDQENHLIHIGPTIGILTNVLPNEAAFDARSHQAELIYLSKIGRNLSAQVFIFTPDSIHWDNKTVLGYVYQQLNQTSGKWISSIYALPDVVYDRIPSRSGEDRSFNQYTRKKLKAQANLKYFNPSFLNKWTVHSHLIKNEDLWPYLPETKKLNRNNLKEMADRYAVLYLKPANGSLGHGIIKVDIQSNGHMNYVVYKKGRHRGNASNFNQLLQQTIKARGGKSYIVQQGLTLAKYQQSSFDIRIIYQKNLQGEWQITKKFVRVAPPGSSVSNISRGGSVETSKRVFRTLFSGHKDLIERKNQEIKDLCRRVSETLERSSHHDYGELGLDIGIDANQRLWLIEVNSKPRKTTETEMSQRIVRNTFIRPLEYAMFLAGFGKNLIEKVEGTGEEGLEINT